MKKLITLLATVCLLGLGQVFAQETAEDFYEIFSNRRWSTQALLGIQTTYSNNFMEMPEYQVRMDYFLCKALTHEVTSIETRIVSFKANDFSKKEVLLTAPAGYQIRDDIHFDIQIKVNGRFETALSGFRRLYLDAQGRLNRVITPFNDRERGVLVMGGGELPEEWFFRDDIPGETYKKLNDPKLPTKAFFYVDEDGNAFVYNNNRKDLAKNTANYANADGVDRPVMRKGFWPQKINGYHVTHNMVFKLKYNNGATLPSNLKLYLFIESPIYDRNGNLLRIADCTHGGIELELSSKSSNTWIQGTFNMDNDERLFAYPVWNVVVKDLNTGECHAVDWGLLDMHIMSSEKIYVFDVIGTVKNGNLVQSIKNGDIKVAKGK